MNMYEVIAAGFDGGSDATDDRVIWVKSSTGNAVDVAIKDTGAKCSGVVNVDSVDADYDLSIPGDSERLTTELLTFASLDRNKNRSL